LTFKRLLFNFVTGQLKLNDFKAGYPFVGEAAITKINSILCDRDVTLM
jgi:hypothetical protein